MYHSDKQEQFWLSVTLSIPNTSLTDPIVIRSARLNHSLKIEPILCHQSSYLSSLESFCWLASLPVKPQSNLEFPHCFSF
ncbi:DUF3124 domain-containing protein [Merismopedia glauca]|uniref:DUF3124 domain-containing protein n=1 Tax=Merismopedia glauca TaxID=292586 RepID=UPI001C63B049